MHVVNFGTGLMLNDLVEDGYNSGSKSLRLLQRAQDFSDESFLSAEKAMPTHIETVKRVAKVKEKKNKDKYFRKEIGITNPSCSIFHKKAI